MTICQNCKNNFEVTEKDREFLTMLKVPEPTFCAPCRMVRRFAFRNERSLYKRKCDLCHKESIMQYPSDAPFPVYCKSCWWSDKWSPAIYAKEYDFNRPFFQQFRELFLSVPRCGLRHQGNIINSEYTNSVTDMKNCYLVFATTRAEDSRYSGWVNGSKQMQDCFAAIKSERCYECIDCTNCYELLYSRESTNCRSSWFLQNCINVTDSIACVNLRNKQYCIFNEQYTKEEYEQKRNEMDLESRKGIQALREKFEIFRKGFIVPALVNRRSIDSSGNWLEDCKDAQESFNCQNLEHARHCHSVFTAKDCMDYCQWGAGAERVYEANSCGMQVANLKFASECWIGVTDCEYVISCHNSSKNLFGCVGLRNAEYRILNKQYEPGEYSQMIESIKKQMDEVPYADEGGRIYRYGEFFPSEFSPHAYNESLSQEFFSITPGEAAALHLPWRDAPRRRYAITMSADSIPESITEVRDDALKQIIACNHKGDCLHQCTTAFRLIPEELAFYRSFNLPLPQLCPNCRHYERLALRNPMHLWPCVCACPGSSTHAHGEVPCQNQFESSYAPDPRYAEGFGEASRPEKVYCIECYQQEVA